MRTALGIDVGQSGCRVALVVDGQDRGRVTGGGFRYVPGGDAVATAVRGVSGALEDLSLPASPIDAVCIGLAGPAGQSGGAEVAGALRDRLGPVPLVRVTGDHVTGYAGLLGVRPGGVVVAGTGVGALAIGPDGCSARADGWGYLFGDDGGGWWVGRQALRAALRAVDGRGPATLLATRLGGGAEATRTLHRELYADGDVVRRVAALTPMVADCAREGDQVARLIFQRAGAELAATLAAAVRRALGRGGEHHGTAEEQEPPRLGVSSGGGLFAAGDLLAVPFAEALRAHLPQAELLPPRGSGLDGAVRLATTDDLGVMAPLVFEHRL